MSEKCSSSKISKFYVSEFNYTESSMDLNSINLEISKSIKAYTEKESLDKCNDFLLVTMTDIKNKDNPDDLFHIKLVVKFFCLCNGDNLTKDVIKKDYCPFVVNITNNILKNLTTNMNISPIDLLDGNY